MLKRRRAGHFSNFTRENYLSYFIGLIPDKRTMHPLYRCIWSQKKVCAVTKSRQHCLQTNFVLVEFLERPREKLKNLSSTEPRNPLVNLAPTAVSGSYQIPSSNRTSCSKMDLRLGGHHHETLRMTSPFYRERPWHSPSGCVQTPGSRPSISISHERYGCFRYQRGDLRVVAMREQKGNTKVQGNALKLTHIETNKPSSPTLIEFMNAHDTDAYCKSTRPTARIPCLSLSFDKNGLTVRHSPIDGILQKFVPQ